MGRKGGKVLGEKHADVFASESSCRRLGGDPRQHVPCKNDAEYTELDTGELIFFLDTTSIAPPSPRHTILFQINKVIESRLERAESGSAWNQYRVPYHST